MIDYSLDEHGATAVLKLTGPATVQQAQKIHAALLEIVGKAQHLTLNVSGVTGADLTFLQLMCSAHRRLQRSGGVITLAGPVSEGLRQAIISAGFVGCAGGNDKSGLWIGEAS